MEGIGQLFQQGKNCLELSITGFFSLAQPSSVKAFNYAG